VRIVSRCVDCAFISSGWAAVCPFSWAGGVSLPGGGVSGTVAKGTVWFRNWKERKGKGGGCWWCIRMWR
jgi:hypothetical protein